MGRELPLIFKFSKSEKLKRKINISRFRFKALKLEYTFSESLNNEGRSLLPHCDIDNYYS